MSEAVSWAESPILIGPAGETVVEIVGVFGLTVSGSASLQLHAGHGFLLSFPTRRSSDLVPAVLNWCAFESGTEPLTTVFVVGVRSATRPEEQTSEHRSHREVVCASAL